MNDRPRQDPAYRPAQTLFLVDFRLVVLHNAPRLKRSLADRFILGDVAQLVRAHDS